MTEIGCPSCGNTTWAAEQVEISMVGCTLSANGDEIEIEIDLFGAFVTRDASSFLRSYICDECHFAIDAAEITSLLKERRHAEA